MTQAAVSLAMLMTVVSAVVAARMGRRRGLAMIGVVSGVALTLIMILGGEIHDALGGLAPLLLIMGYAALAELLTRAGVAARLAVALRPGPVPVLVVAAVASILLSNDIVIVAFAGLVLLRPTRVVDAAALFVGANVTGGMLPTGSPTNLIIFDHLSFSRYVSMSLPVTVAMFAVALAAFALGWKFLPARITGRDAGVGREARDELVWETRHKLLTALVVGLIAVQPLCDLVGISRAMLGLAICALTAGVSLLLSERPLSVLGGAPWQIAPVVLVLTTGATVLTATEVATLSPWTWALTGFFVAAVGTDLLAAAVAAPAVLSGVIASRVALVAVTAGSFTTPVGSISGILLLEEHQQAGVRVAGRTIVIAGVVSVLCWAAGTAVALAT